MNITFVILVIILFVMPFNYLKRVYSYDSPKFKFAKVLNIVISIILITIISYEDSNLGTVLTDFSEFRKNCLVSVGGINKWTIFIGKFFLIISNIYLIVILLFTTKRSERYRIKIVRLLIIYIPFKALDIYRIIFNEFTESWNNILLYSIITTMIIYVPILIFYISRPVKEMMSITDATKAEIINTMRNK